MVSSDDVELGVIHQRAANTTVSQRNAVPAKIQQRQASPSRATARMITTSQPLNDSNSNTTTTSIIIRKNGADSKFKQGELGMGLLSETKQQQHHQEEFRGDANTYRDDVAATTATLTRNEPTQTTSSKVPFHWGKQPLPDEVKRQSTQYAILFYYFFHGLSFELPVTALYLVLKEHFHLLPYQYSYIKSLDWIPWTLKPLFGYISDNYPIFGLRRCPYLAMGVVMGVVGWFMLASPWIESLWMYLTIIIFNSISMVLTETAVDSLIAEIARTEPEDNVGYIQSCSWTLHSAGSIVGALTPIVAFSFGFHPKYVLLINAVVTGISGLSLPWMHETEHVEPAQQENVMAALQNPLLLKALAFVFIVSSSPTSGDAFQYFQSDVLNFSPAYISWTVVIMTTANFGAAYAYAAFLRKRNMRIIFRNVIWFIIAVGLFNIIVVKRWNVEWGIPDRLFIMGDYVAQIVAGQFIFMPVAVLAARMSPAGGEGFVYAIAMSVLNVSLAFQEFFSGLLAKLFGIESGHYENLTKLILTVSALTLLPLAFLHFVPELSQLGGEEDDGTDGVYNKESTDALFKDASNTGGGTGNFTLLDNVPPDDPSCGSHCGSIPGHQSVRTSSMSSKSTSSDDERHELL